MNDVPSQRPRDTQRPLDAPTEPTGEQPRISMGMIFEEFLAFFSLERGALLTTKLLASRPGASIRAYLEGAGGSRKSMTNPLRYLAMTTALVTLAFFFFIPRQGFVDDVQKGIDFGEQQDGATKKEPSEIESKRQQVVALLTEIETDSKSRLTRANARKARESIVETLAERVGEITIAWMNVLLLVSLPLNACLTSICFRKSNFNVAEHFVINAYILGGQNVAAVVMLVPSGIGELAGVLTGLYLVLSFCYQFIVWRQVFELKTWFWGAFGLGLVLVSATAYLVLQTLFTFALLWLTT
ncbi:MAG: hypothetical protein AAFU85_06075 [Planctomycetota bacterium]